MVQKRIRRTDQEWLDLIQECRTSGLTDKAWCEQQHIQRVCSIIKVLEFFPKSTCKKHPAQQLLLSDQTASEESL